MPLPLSCSAVICLRRRRGGPLWPPAGFGTGFIPRGGFRPAGRVSFPSIGKKPKDRRGRLTSPSETSSLRLQFVLPRTPRLRGIPLYPSARFPARKIRFRASFLPGHRALMRCKIPACTISPLRLVPTSRGRGCGSGHAGRGRSKILRDERGNVPQRGTGGHGGLPALRGP